MARCARCNTFSLFGSFPGGYCSDCSAQLRAEEEARLERERIEREEAERKKAEEEAARHAAEEEARRIGKVIYIDF